MNRGDIYRSQEKIPERGYKPGYYVVVSRRFIVLHEDVDTVICAPIYSEVLGLHSEVVLGIEDGLRHASAIRCDFLMLMFKKKLTYYVGQLSHTKMLDLNRALMCALDLPL